MNNKTKDETKNVPIIEQVREEFETAEDNGESELDQLKSELNEEHYMLPSPMNSEEDVDFINRNADQPGEAFGLDYQQNEPLDTFEKIEKRDDERWELNPASADDFEETNEEIKGGK